MRRNNSLLGGILIILGGLLLASKLLFNNSILTLGPEDFWPMIILLLGVGFELAYFITLRAPGLLVPGGILTTCGILFFFEVLTNWKFAAYTWPVYLLGVTIGLFQLYLFSGRHKGLLVAAGILGGIVLACFIIILFRIFLGTIDISLVIPVILVLGGLALVFGKSRPKTGNW
ncbi:MAG: hypothetical protein ABFD25_07670 [Clostridiaceae bacterium]